jgi:signal transduction histidine kinase
MPMDAADKSRLDQLEREAHRQRALQRVTAGLSAAATREEILRSFLDEGSRVVAASSGVAFLIQPGTQTARLVAHVGLGDELARAIATRSLEGPSPVSVSMREGRPVWMASAGDLDQAFAELETTTHQTFHRRAVAALPLNVSGMIVGAIAFAFPDERAFEQGERDFLTVLAERVQAAMERALLLEEAETLLRFNEIVSGILAHDLRNPLAAVLMNAHLLKAAEPERTRMIGRRIVTSGERMSRMIDQILEWTRLRSGHGGIQLARAATDLGAVTDDVVSEIRVRNGDVTISVDSHGDLRGTWDADRLAQVVSNLVGNAIEHAARPGVSISLDGEGAEVRLIVGNEGRIDDALVPLVFEPFRGRAAGSRARGKGLGLGLYITREIVRAHGGNVELVAVEGHVEFVVTLSRGEVVPLGDVNRANV